MKSSVIHISKPKLRGVGILYAKGARADCQLRLVLPNDPVGQKVRNSLVRSGSMECIGFRCISSLLRDMIASSDQSDHNRFTCCSVMVCNFVVYLARTRPPTFDAKITCSSREDICTTTGRKLLF